MSHDHTQTSLASLGKLKTHISLERWCSLYSTSREYEITRARGESQMSTSNTCTAFFFMNEKWSHNFLRFFHFHLVRSKKVKRSLSGSPSFDNLEMKTGFHEFLKVRNTVPSEGELHAGVSFSFFIISLTLQGANSPTHIHTNATALTHTYEKEKTKKNECVHMYTL